MFSKNTHSRIYHNGAYCLQLPLEWCRRMSPVHEVEKKVDGGSENDKAAEKMLTINNLVRGHIKVLCIIPTTFL